MSAHRHHEDGGASDEERSERISEKLETLRESGELGHKDGQELLQLSVMETANLVVSSSDLDWEDASRMLQLLTDAAENKADEE